MVPSPLSSLHAGDAELLHLGDQCGALQADPGGGAFHAANDPVGFSQRLENVVTRGIHQRRGF